MKLKILLYLLPVLNLFSSGIFATHIVGGELNYRYLGGDKYEIRLTIYRDCWYGQVGFDNPAALGIFDSNNNFLDSIMMVYKDTLLIPPVINDPCIVPPVNICYSTTTYIDTITLPPRSGGYQLAYQRCCRNNSISNIIRPDSTGATYYATIPSPDVVTVNSNPRYNNLPPPFACANKPFIFDHSATDDDGDSLVYEICDPWHGARSVGNFGCVPQPCGVRPQPPFAPPYNSVKWKPPYSLGNVFGGVPLAVDPQTGLLTAVPNKIGQFVYGVCVKEYRNGVFISETKRDYQLNILPCESSVNSLPANIVQCGTKTVQLVNNSTGATSYKWDFGDPTTNADTSTLPNPVYVYPDTGIYHPVLIATGIAPECTDTATSTVQIWPPFITSFTYVKTPCTYDAAFTPSSTMNGSGSPNSWLWEFGDATSSSAQFSTHTYPGAGSFLISLVTRTDKGCVDTVLKQIAFDTVPVANTGPDIIVCKNTTTIQLVNKSTGAVSYKWDFGDLTTNADTSTMTYPVYVYPDTGIYHPVLIAYGADPACIDTVVTTVQIWPDFTTSFTYSKVPCSYNAAFTPSATMNGTGSPFSWLWQFGDATNSSLQIPTHSFANTGPYQVTLITTTDKGCIDTVSNPISFTLLPTSNAGPDFTICKGSPVSIGNTNDPSYTYDWSPGIHLNDSMIPLPVANPDFTTKYFLTVTDVNGCTAKDSVLIDVAFSMLNISDTIIICKGDSAYLNPAANLNYNYAWSPSSWLNDTTIANPYSKPPGNMTYNVLIQTKSSSGDTCLINKTVNVLLTKDTVNVDGGRDTTVCRSVILTPVYGGNILSFIWSTNPLFTDTINGTSASVDVGPVKSPQTYYVKVNGKYCSDYDSVKVFLNPADISPLPDEEVCIGKEAVLGVKNNDPGDILTYQWSPASSIVSGDNTANPVIKPVENTTFKVIATNQTGCTDSATMNVVVNDVPVVQAFADDDTLEYEGSTVIHSTVGDFTYNWSPASGLNNIHLADVKAAPVTSTTYTVTVTDVNGCSAEVSVFIYVKPKPVCGEPDIFVPNAFSPNEDNRNDKLFVRGNRIDEMYFAVFDRWGEKVFETSQQSVGWDGTYKGLKADPAVFVYYLKATCAGGETYFKKGNVTILR